MSAPKISVLVPVYNSEKYLADTIRSVLSQTYQNFELILLNDASVDHSEQIALSFQDKRILYYKNEHNLGISATRNKLMELADKNSKYIAVLDNDDICLPDRFAVQVDFLEKHPDISIVGSYFELFNSNENLDFKTKMLISLGFIWCHPLYPTFDDAIKGNVLMHPTAMMRFADIKNNHLFYRQEFTPAEDYDLMVQALSKGLRLANIPKILLRYNYHGDNCSLTRKAQMDKADAKVKEEIVALLDIKDYKPYPYWRVMCKKLRLKCFLKV